MNIAAQPQSRHVLWSEWAASIRAIVHCLIHDTLACRTIGRHWLFVEMQCKINDHKVTAADQTKLRTLWKRIWPLHETHKTVGAQSPIDGIWLKSSHVPQMEKSQQQTLGHTIHLVQWIQQQVRSLVAKGQSNSAESVLSEVLKRCMVILKKREHGEEWYQMCHSVGTRVHDRYHSSREIRLLWNMLLENEYPPMMQDTAAKETLLQWLCESWSESVWNAMLAEFRGTVFEATMIHLQTNFKKSSIPVATSPQTPRVSRPPPPLGHYSASRTMIPVAPAGKRQLSQPREPKIHPPPPPHTLSAEAIQDLSQALNEVLGVTKPSAPLQEQKSKIRVLKPAIVPSSGKKNPHKKRKTIRFADQPTIYTYSPVLGPFPVASITPAPSSPESSSNQEDDHDTEDSWWN